jgi:hypothetical protein
MPTGVYVRTKEYSEAMSKAKKGKPCNLVGYWKGRKRRPITEKHRDNLRKAHLGQKAWNTGLKGFNKDYPRSEEWCKKISLGKKNSPKGRGENHFNWNGGSSFEPYSVDWTETLKRSIRERDRYVCKICGVQQGEISHVIHHIDYDKKNSNPNNLTTLCNSCHTKTNYERERWIIYFNNINHG